ncbi:hypothetical protein QG516_00655 [Pedobacter gandavensis]|uniref:hypothetical protein n=1 Tax=Pedobacter gandavensis TaxID=2679963 RepID=UPI00247903A9|nr:hypothetical protein [Pedobacter gandavensis]WGQ10164.1 hypothetical protein QG516_00655 [Pedobacter gandavensis]
MKTKLKEKMMDQNCAIYGLAFIGALVYYIQQATSFWMGVLGVLKAFVWPALLIYKLFEFLKI